MKKYEISFLGEKNEFKTLLEAIQYKQHIISEIENGKYDDHELGFFSSGFRFGEKGKTAIEKKREFCIGIISLKINCYTPSGILYNSERIDDDGKGIGPKEIIKIRNTEINLNRIDKLVYSKGGMICQIHPWGASGIPLKLSICILPDGWILHRGWSWDMNCSWYLHTCDKIDEVNVTEAMIDTVNGLFSGRILFEGLKIAVGGSVQKICPIDVKKEEERTENKIYLA